MDISPIQKFTFKMENDEGQLIVIGEITGEAKIPFLDDLKFKGIIALLNSIDKQNFSVLENEHLFENYMREIEETMNELKKYNQFKGKTNLI